jgi:hypothetical protein
MSGLIARFNDVKKKNPGMSDSDAMEQAMKNQEKYIKEIRKSDKKKRNKIGWIEKLKMGATKEIAERHLSPAGKKYRQMKKAGLEK